MSFIHIMSFTHIIFVELQLFLKSLKNVKEFVIYLIYKRAYKY